LISVSVDPAIDTPERLRDFAGKVQSRTRAGHLSPATLLTSIHSATNSASPSRTKNDHTPMILIGNDEAGYWTRAYGLSSPASLVKLITEAANRK
jgi:protein SCO1/2